jgi:hypothetical protein
MFRRSILPPFAGLKNKPSKLSRSRLKATLGDMFLGNLGLSLNYTALQHGRGYSS